MQSGTFSDDMLNIAPLTERNIIIPFQKPELKPGAEYFINVSFTLKTDTSWAKAGHEIAKKQFALPYAVPKVEVVAADSMEKLTVKDAQDAIAITGKDFTLSFDKKAGVISSFTNQGTELLEQGPVPNFWRAPTDSDLGYYSPLLLTTWRYAGIDRTILDITTEQENASTFTPLPSL